MINGLGHGQWLGNEDDIFFNNLIGRYVNAEGYVKRNWLEEKILDRINSPTCQYVVLVAEPGAGKTGVMASLAKSNPHWLRYFIRRDSITPLSGGDTTSVLLKLGHQLATHHPALFDPQQLEIVVTQRVNRANPESSVVGVRIDDLYVSPFRRTAIRVSQDIQVLDGILTGAQVNQATDEPRLLTPQILQYLALIDPAMLLATNEPDQKIVVLIDAMDEVSQFQGNLSILDWLETSPELPSNLQLVISTRPSTRLTAFQSRRPGRVETIFLSNHSREAFKDTQIFSHRLLTSPTLAPHLANPNAAIERLSQAAEGNFAYLRAYERAVLSAIQENNQVLLDELINNNLLPQGLGALYATYFRNVHQEVNQLGSLEVESPTGDADMFVPAWEGAGQRMLGVLSVARAPLTLEQLMHLCNVRIWKSDALNVLHRFVPFMDQLSTGWQLFHPSVAEYLAHDAINEAPDLAVDGREWHQRIVRKYKNNTNWDQLDWASIDDYGLLHLADHLAEMGNVGRKQIPDLVNANLRKAIWQRFHMELPFKLLVETAIAQEVSSGDTSTDLATAIFLEIVYAGLSHGGRQLPPAVFGLLAKLGRYSEAEAHAQLMPAGEQQFTTWQAIITCTPPKQRHLLGAHDGADRLMAVALGMPPLHDPLDQGTTRRNAIKEAAELLAQYDLTRALSIAENNEVPNSRSIQDSVLAAAARSTVPDSAIRLINKMHKGGAQVAVELAGRNDGLHRRHLLLQAEKQISAEDPIDQLPVLAGLVAGWTPLDAFRSNTAADKLWALVEDDLEEKSDSSRWGSAIVTAASTVQEARADLAAMLLNRVEREEPDASWDSVMIKGAKLWATWGEKGKCRHVVEQVLAYERSLGWYGPAKEIAELAVVVADIDSDWALQLADEAESLITEAVDAATDMHEKDRVDGILGAVVGALGEWDRERALRLARLLGNNRVGGIGWVSFEDRLSALACIGVESVENDPALANELLAECMPDRLLSIEVGRRDPHYLHNGVFRPHRKEAPTSPSLERIVSFLTYLANVENRWATGRNWRPFFSPADVVRSVQGPSGGTPWAFSSWAGVVAAAVEPMAELDLEIAVDLASWPADAGERLIACAALVKELRAIDDDRVNEALQALGRLTVRLPRYEPELDLSKDPERTIYAYLNPSVRARWEAALILPPEDKSTAQNLVTATGSGYLRDTYQAQLCQQFAHSLDLIPEDENLSTELGKMLDFIKEYSDRLQVDLVRLTAFQIILPRNPIMASSILSSIQHPNVVFSARLIDAMTKADADNAVAEARSVLKSAPPDLSDVYPILAICSVVDSTAENDSLRSRRLIEFAVEFLSNTNPWVATWGNIALAKVANNIQRRTLLVQALVYSERIEDSYLQEEALVDLLIPAAFTRDVSIIIEMARRLLSINWGVLMESLRRAIAPILKVFGPSLIRELDQALRAAQHVLAPNNAASHFDAVASPAHRTDVFAPIAPSHVQTRYSDYGPLYLAAKDLPGLRLMDEDKGHEGIPGDYAYTACRGLHAGYQLWEGHETDTVWRLMDIRFVFPTPEEALIFHREQLPYNCEGNLPVSGAPLVGDDCHVFGGTRILLSGGEPRTILIYVFRLDSIIVKLFAAQGSRSSKSLVPDVLQALAFQTTNKIRKIV